MRLLEILDKKITNFEVHDEEDSHGGNVLQITAKIGDRKIQFYGDSNIDDKKSYWDIGFTEEKSDKRHTYELTGSGNEFAVFAFIKQCMEILIDKHHPDIIHFTADKTSGSNRAKLYEKLLRKNLKGYNLRVSDDGSRQVKFILEKK